LILCDQIINGEIVKLDEEETKTKLKTLGNQIEALRKEFEDNLEIKNKDIEKLKLELKGKEVKNRQLQEELLYFRKKSSKVSLVSASEDSNKSLGFYEEVLYEDSSDTIEDKDPINNQRERKVSSKLAPKESNIVIDVESSNQVIKRENPKSVIKQENITQVERKEKHQCEQCSFETIDKSKLKKHLDTVHISISCDQCEYKTMDKGNLKKHIESLHKGIKFSCGQCSYTAALKGNLKKHIFTNHQNMFMQYPCNDCGYKTIRKSVLEKHVKIEHGGAKSDIIKEPEIILLDL